MNITTDVRIQIVNEPEVGHLSGSLVNVKGSKGLIIFAHGSGSDSRSLRNQYLSQILNNDGLSILLLDLLTIYEQDIDIRSQRILKELPGVTLNKFNIELLAKRLVTITRWAIEYSETKDMAIGYFGASTGAAAAFAAASHKEISERVTAIVTRSGRPELAIESLPFVKAPSLLIVGENDTKKIIQNNENAIKKIGGDEKKLLLIPGATHLFEEDGTLEQVGKFSSDWFRCYLGT
jgi:dienelactone hydrolase